MLEAVLAGVGERIDTDDPARHLARAARHGCDQPVAARQAGELGAGLVGDARVFRPVDDRREHAVDVEEQRGGRGSRAIGASASTGVA